MFQTGMARILIVFALLLTGYLPGSSGLAYADGVVPGHVLIRLNDANRIGEIDNDYDTAEDDYIANTGLYSLHTPVGITETKFAEQLRKDSRVAWAETDTYLNPPEVNGEPFHFAFDAGPAPGNYSNQQAFDQVHIGKAQKWSSGLGILVAILDTGATFHHPVLRLHYLTGYNVLQPNLPANDIRDGRFNGAVGHGTMIAGIIARLAPGAKILPVRVLNGDGIGTVLDVAKGIDYAINRGARVLNMSFGTSQRSQALDEALGEASDAGAVIVASAGNDGSSNLHFPAASDNVLAVSSVEANNRKSTYANYGDFITVVAPGSGIRSTYYTGGYANWSGTSFAAPIVTAEAALLLSRQPALTSPQIQCLICQTAHSVDIFNPRYPELLGNGLVDIEAAVRSIP
jgi:subtilisin family serine protease